MRNTLIALAMGLIASTLVIAGPAEAAPRGGCVTKAEYRKVREGDSLATVRRKVGQHGRVTSSSSYSDGDGFMDVAFRQCGKTWTWSSIRVSFEMTEREVWVEDWYCDDYGCEDWGYWETQYGNPMRATSKYAYWF